MLDHFRSQPHLLARLVPGPKSETLGPVSDAAWAVTLRQARIPRSLKVMVERELRISFKLHFSLLAGPPTAAEAHSTCL